MAARDSERLTMILQSIGRGDAPSAERLLPLVYEELRTLARARLARTPPGNTLQATALVHEAYMRVVGEADPGWDGRGHFFGAAATAMRDILVEQARRKGSLKRGGDRKRVGADAIENEALAIEPPADDVLALDEALKKLEAEDPRKGQVVALRFFAGLTNEEIAAALDISLPTVERDWRFARAWLQREMGGARLGDERAEGSR
jgi:RNA polymerase sigma factor (TIGR02999 family)